MSNAPLVLGYDGVTEQPKRKRRAGQGKGWQTIREWRGPTAKINDLKYDPLLYLAEEVDVVENGVNAKCVATFPFDDDVAGGDRSEGLAVTWECHPQEIEKDLRTHSTFSAVTSELATADKKIEEGKADEIIDNPSAWDAKTVSYVQLRLAGVQSYKAEYYVLTKTTRCGTASDVKAAMVAGGTVVKVSSLSIPAGAKFSLTSSWEALKGKPDVVQVPGGWQIVEKWTVAETWSATLYSGGTGTP